MYQTDQQDQSKEIMPVSSVRSVVKPGSTCQLGRCCKIYSWKVKEIMGIVISILDDSRITSIKSPSFFMTPFISSLTKCMVLPPQSHDCSCYVSRRILAPPQSQLQQHTDLRAHDFEHSPDLWRQPRLGRVTLTWNLKLCAIMNLTLEGPCIIFCNIYTVLPQTLYQRGVSVSAFLTTYHSLHIQHLKEKLLRMDHYGPKHVELTPEHQ